MSSSNQNTSNAVTAISAAYFSKNPVPQGEIRNVMEEITKAVHSSLNNNSNKPNNKFKHQVTDEWVTCAECGKKFKYLTKHLSKAHGLTVEQYLQKHNLPPNTMTVAPIDGYSD